VVLARVVVVAGHAVAVPVIVAGIALMVTVAVE
jgi:hypothetical protein